MHAFIGWAAARRFRKARDAVTAIEFALLSPVFIGLLFGIITFGIHIAAANSVAQLCGDVARATVAGIDESERVAIAEDFIGRNIQKYVLLQADHLTLTVADSASEPQQFDVVLEYDASDLPAAVWASMFERPAPVIRSSATVTHGGF